MAAAFFRGPKALERTWFKREKDGEQEKPGGRTELSLFFWLLSNVTSVALTHSLSNSVSSFQKYEDMLLRRMLSKD